ncbi:(4Fe-4S)-binding protein [Jeotgalibacillus marinus]|uniref:(4Fe-4S)-binding protein n=1 Tax=Jeotgalibacillus marinus TaxID=86667 RepID=A0ABV3Q7J3_9BACL
MNTESKRYTGENIDVIFHRERCIHAAKCVRGLPKVFNLKEKPWVNADGETVDKIVEVIEKCPSGALQYERKDGFQQESSAKETTIEATLNGPMFIRGNLSIKQKEQTIKCTRAALCGCGSTQNGPFCDNSHVNKS